MIISNYKKYAPTPRKDTNPVTSVIVVTQTLDEIAGSIFIFFKETRINIPNNSATIIVKIMEIEIIKATKKDISDVYKVISTELPPTKFAPYKEQQAAIKQSLILIGGDGSGYDYGESDWYRLAFEFKNINTTFVNSRRTPKFAWDNLKENSGPNQTFLDLEDTPFEKLQDAIDTHSHIFVTADSTSMIVEILTRGYFVNVIELRGPIKREHHHEIISSFEDKGLLRILRLNQLHLSEDKYQENVKEFVVAERDALKSKVLDLL